MLCSLHYRVASIDAAHRSNQAPFFPTHCPLPPREPLALRCLIHWARPAHNLKLQENPKNHPWPSELSAASWHQADFSKSVLWNLTLKKSDKHERQWINNIYVCMCLYIYILYEQIWTKVINKNSRIHLPILDSPSNLSPAVGCGSWPDSMLRRRRRLLEKRYTPRLRQRFWI